MYEVRTYSIIRPMPAANTDQVHLAKLRDHYAQHGVLPSYAGISAAVGFRSKAPAQKLARRLRDKGYLQEAPGGKLAPTRKFFETALLTPTVRAGGPRAIEGALDAELVTLDSYLIDKPSETVLLRVRGDSMVDAGILDGDLAVVRRASTAHTGDIVVAIVDDEFTVKELRLDEGRPVLVPHNRAYERIRPTASLELYGVVQGIVRRYKGSSLASARIGKAKGHA